MNKIIILIFVVVIAILGVVAGFFTLNGSTYQVNQANVTANQTGAIKSEDTTAKPFEQISTPPNQCEVGRTPAIQDASYDEARVKILAKGWKQVQAHSSLSDFAISSGNTKVFWDREYYELQDCAGTGLAQCLFLFQDSCKNYLHVSTAGEEQGDYHATVQTFSVNQSR